MARSWACGIANCGSRACNFIRSRFLPRRVSGFSKISSAFRIKIHVLARCSMNPRSHTLIYRAVFVCCVLILVASLGYASPTSYLGFDANDYPGDAALAAMRRTFSFAGYWLNNPPGANTNDWVGKRAALLQNDFGFLVLFNGRTISELKSLGNAAEAGKKDGQSAALLAQQEGFHSGTVIFLDQEEGGRMTEDQNAYILAWVDAVIAGGFRVGIYCSGMPASAWLCVFEKSAAAICQRCAVRLGVAVRAIAAAA